MKTSRIGGRRGFSLVELLAVVLILGVLAGVAIPLYMNTRKSSAARACMANIALVTSAQTAYALRNGTFSTTIAGLTEQTEGIHQAVTCPLDGTEYQVAGGGAGQDFTITCPNEEQHTLIRAGTYHFTITLPPPETAP